MEVGPGAWYIKSHSPNFHFMPWFHHQCPSNSVIAFDYFQIKSNYTAASNEKENPKKMPK
jgi:hypothetical protein